MTPDRQHRVDTRCADFIAAPRKRGHCFHFMQTKIRTLRRSSGICKLYVQLFAPSEREFQTPVSAHPCTLLSTTVPWKRSNTCSRDAVEGLELMLTRHDGLFVRSDHVIAGTRARWKRLVRRRRSAPPAGTRPWRPSGSGGSDLNFCCKLAAAGGVSG